MRDEDAAGTDAPPGLGRRGFLKRIGATAGALALPRFSLTGAQARDAYQALRQAAQEGVTATIDLIRPEDLLNLKIELLNLVPRSRFLRAPTLHAVDEERPSFLVVTLPGQHILEARSKEDEPTPALPVRAFLSGPTTLVFRVPPHLLPLDFVAASLLRWNAFELVERPAGRAMCEPTRETSILFPSRLAFVTDEPIRIGAAATPRVIEGRAELWRAEFGDTALRAIWTPDSRDAGCDDTGASEAPDFDAPLQGPGDRRDIALSARRPSSQNPNARPVKVHGLVLSPLGAWADIRGAWDPPASAGLVAWENRTDMGRDHYVRVARSGFLFPWGHKASLVKVTDRRILPSPDGVDAAYLRYRFYLVVTQPLRLYPHPDEAPEGGHPTLPFRSVEFITLETPTLDTWRPDPASALPDGAIGDHGRDAFWPKVAGSEFRFAIETRDWSGRLASTEVSAIFVGFEAAKDPAVLADVEHAYIAERSSSAGVAVVRPGLRTAAFRGQPVAFAVENARDDTSLETGSVTFGATRRQEAGGDAADWPFSAVMAHAAVRVPSVAHIAGFTETLGVAYDARFDPAHPENNPAELFLVAGSAPHLDFTALGVDKSGGVATPNLRIGGLSRATGVVGDDIDHLADGSFQPGGFFPDDAELLGGVKMGDILAASPVVDTVPFCDGSTAGERSALPTFAAIYTNDGDQPGGRACFQLDWQTTRLKSFTPVFTVGDKACLRIQASVCVGAGGETEFTQQRGHVSDFEFTIPKVVRLRFEHFDFERVAGRPLRVNPKFRDEGGVELLDALKWIERLMKAIKTYVSGLMGNGPGIGDYFDYSISPRAVKLFFKVELPKIPMGALTLSNMHTRLGIELPLLSRDGILIFFDFSTRDNPFAVSVPPFGGGGFFGIGVTTREVRRIEGAIEFGGRFDIAIAGASGEAFVMVGVYYSMKDDGAGRRQELAAYLRAGGSLRIIELITVSVEIYLVLIYIDQTASPDYNSLCGEATLKLIISIAFFSTGVELRFRKCFKGAEANDAPDLAGGVPAMLIDDAFAAPGDDGESPPRFREAVNGREGWREYWRAFAV